MKLLTKILGTLLSVVIIITPLCASTVSGVISSPTSTGALKNASVAFTLNQAGIIAGSFVLTTSPVTCGTDESGNIVGLVEPLVNPSFSVNYASGTLPASTYYTRLTYWNASGETQPGPESSFVVTGAGTLTVIAPVYQPASASGYKIYMGTTPGGEVLQTVVTGWASHAYSAAINTVPGAMPASNSTVCDLKFNDSIIPTDTVYNVSVTSQAGAPVPGFSQPWFLSGSSINVTNNYPIAVNRTARFPYPIIANPSSNALQSINSPLTLNGYSLTAGSVVLPNNASCPAAQAGKTLICTNNSGVSQVSQNGSAYTNLLGGTGGWSLNGTDIRESTTTNSVLIGLLSSDLTPQSGGAQAGTIVANQFLYSVSAATNARVLGLGSLNGSSTITLASGVSGTQTTGWPLTFRVCPSAGDCSMLGTTEAGRVELGGRWILGLGAATSSDFVGGNLISAGTIVEVNSSANAQAMTMGALGGGGGYGFLESTFTGAGSYKPLTFRTNGGEAGRFTVTNRNLIVGATTDTTVNEVIAARRDQNDTTLLEVDNETSGTAARADFKALALNGGTLIMGVTTDGFTPAGGLIASQAHIRSTSSAGMVIASTAGTLTFQPGGATVEATLTNATGLTLNHALPVTSGGSGSTSAVTDKGVMFASGTTSFVNSTNLTFTNATPRLLVNGGLLLQSAAQTSPAAGTFLQAYYDSGADLGNLKSFDFTGGAYKNLRVSGLVLTLGASATDIITIAAAKVNVRLANVSIFANNAAAIAGGLSSGDLYRTNADPDFIAIVH